MLSCIIPQSHNGMKLLPNPTSESPHSPSWARPHSQGIAQVWMKPHPRLRGGARLVVEEEEFEVRQVTKGNINSEGSDSIEYFGVRQVSESDCPLVEYIEGWKGGRTSSRVMSSYGSCGQKNEVIIGKQNWWPWTVSTEALGAGSKC